MPAPDDVPGFVGRSNQGITCSFAGFKADTVSFQGDGGNESFPGLPDQFRSGRGKCGGLFKSFAGHPVATDGSVEFKYSVMGNQVGIGGFLFTEILQIMHLVGSFLGDSEDHRLFIDFPARGIDRNMGFPVHILLVFLDGEGEDVARDGGTQPVSFQFIFPGGHVRLDGDRIILLFSGKGQFVSAIQRQGGYENGSGLGNRDRYRGLGRAGRRSKDTNLRTAGSGFFICRGRQGEAGLPLAARKPGCVSQVEIPVFLVGGER